MNQPRETWAYVLTDTGERGTLTTKDGYVICPKCGQKKLARISPQSVIVSAGLWCRKCGEVNISILSES